MSKATEQVAELKEAKSEVEKELAILKSTDLAKDNELLKLKLKVAEKDLVASQSEASRLTLSNTTLESNAKKIKAYFKAVDLLQQSFFGGGRLEYKLPEIGKAISALGDKALSDKWRDIEQTVRADLADDSWSPAPLGEMTDALINRIKNFLP